ncbi:MAG: non-heme iron oxygenase ferredoxin subunit [Candidatus Eremiobacteraeota bacterium]|nr:non-heme iron oxygenase ferredoxin subunit [Candidatus Eremiobacteraeota bacterium]
MPRYIRVADSSEVPPGSAKACVVDGRQVALFNVEGAFYALENICPHQGAPLTDGYLEGPLLTCSWHAWCFDVRTGKMSLADISVIPTFEVRVNGTEIRVRSEPRA